jgi:hypothetical protein
VEKMENWKVVGTAKKLNRIRQSRIVAEKGNLIKTYVLFDGKETFVEFYTLEDIKKQIKNNEAIIIPCVEEFANKLFQ